MRRMAQVGDRVQTSREAIAQRDWDRAYELLSAAEAEQPLAPDELDLLVEAAIWSGPERATPHIEAAYARHLEAGNVHKAAIYAVTLAHDYGSTRLQRSVGAGWLARAARLLADEQEGPAHGYLALEQALLALGKGDLETALERARFAEEVGRRHGDRALEVRGLQRQGMVLVGRGDVAEGKLLLDEASAAALGGELDPYSTVVIYCNTIGACRDVAAFDQAGEWTERATAFCDENALKGFPGMCRVNRAEVMRFEGKLAEAEETAAQAFEELRAWAPRIAAAALYEIGEVRLRLGDLAKAEEMLGMADELGRDPEPGHSLLLLARGKTGPALASIRRALDDETLSMPARGRLLPAFVEIALAADEVDEADRAAEELRAIADGFDTSALLAAAAHAQGAVQLAQGNAQSAAARLRRALRLWQDSNAAYEAARSRELIGRAYRLDGDEEGALRELESAAAAFDRLGARLDSERLAGLLGRDAGARVRKTFMFTDIVDSTKLIEAVGDEKFARALREHDDLMKTIVRTNEGEIVDHTGDGFFVAFDDARNAANTAVAFQKALSGRGLVLDVRIGLHAAEATSLGADYRGRGVHTAARLGAAAGAGEILASRETADALDGVVRTTEPRTVELKGLSEPHEVVSLVWQ
jgi:class 3 adenylate cyclase